MCNFRHQKGNKLMYCNHGTLMKKGVIFGCIQTSKPEVVGKCPYCNPSSGTAIVVPLSVVRFKQRKLVPANAQLY